MLNNTALSVTGTEKRLVWTPLSERGGPTNLEIRHMVLQQSLSIADVLFSSHKHKGNHALMKQRRGDLE